MGNFRVYFNGRILENVPVTEALVFLEEGHKVERMDELDVRTSSPWYRAMRAAGHSHAVCMEELSETDALDDVAHPTWGA